MSQMSACSSRVKRVRWWWTAQLLVAGLILGPSGAVAAEPAAAELEFFEKKIRPLLVKHCYECHGGEDVEAGLRLDSSQGWLRGGDNGPAIVPGKPDESLLIQAIRYGGDFEMPPKEKLPDEAIKLFEQWVGRGAPAPREADETIKRSSAIDVLEGRNFWAYRPVADDP